MKIDRYCPTCQRYTPHDCTILEHNRRLGRYRYRFTCHNCKRVECQVLAVRNDCASQEGKP